MTIIIHWYFITGLFAVIGLVLLATSKIDEYGPSTRSIVGLFCVLAACVASAGALLGQRMP